MEGSSAVRKGSGPLRNRVIAELALGIIRQDPLSLQKWRLGPREGRQSPERSPGFPAPGPQGKAASQPSLTSCVLLWALADGFPGGPGSLLPATGAGDQGGSLSAEPWLRSSGPAWTQEAAAPLRQQKQNGGFVFPESLAVGRSQQTRLAQGSLVSLNTKSAAFHSRQGPRRAALPSLEVQLPGPFLALHPSQSPSK